MPRPPVKDRTKPSGARAPGGEPPDLLSPHRTPVWEVAAVLLMRLAMAGATWTVPRPTGDYYVALAGARDVMDGKLGKPGTPLVRALGAVGVQTGGPDDWSWAQPRPVWLNQNWGTHLLFYAARWIFGPNGAPGLKALLMLTMGAVIALACRQHKVRWPVCILLGGCAVIGGWAYIDLRPNLILLTLAPMMYWLLARTRPDPHRIWWALLLLLFWGNMHGSFNLGLVMMALWTVCEALPAAVKGESRTEHRLLWFCTLGFFALIPVAVLMGCLWKEVDVYSWLGGEPGYWVALAVPLAGLLLVRKAPQAVRDGFRRWWPVLVAPVIGLFLVTVVTPFGLENLSHSLIAFRSEEWRKVAEWRPVLPLEPVHYGSTTEFFIAMGLLALLAAVRPLANVFTGRRKAGAADVALVAFSLVVAVVVAWSASGVVSELGRRVALCQAGIDRGYLSPEQVRDVQGQVRMFSSLRSDAVVPLWVFLGIAVVAGYSAFRVFGSLIRDDEGASPPEKADLSLLLFAMVLTGAVLFMGYRSRRFVTLSFGLLAPLLAMQLGWLFEQAYRVQVFRYARPAVLLALAVMVPARAMATRWLPRYQADNPWFMPFLNTVYDRMTDTEAYIHGGCDFLNLNGVSGNAVQEWRWEGFLHWRSPQVKGWVGGRAQQAYDEKTYIRRMNLWGVYIEPGVSPEKAVEAYDLSLQRMNVSLVVGPMDPEGGRLVNALSTRPGSRWAYLYYDRENVILGDTGLPHVEALVDKIIKGEANYPDRVPGSGAASRAMLLCSLPSRFGVTAQQKRLALEQANREIPALEFCVQLLQMQARGELPPGHAVRYFAEQFAELEDFHKNPYEDLKVLVVRRQLARWLAEQAARDGGWTEVIRVPDRPPQRVPLEYWIDETMRRDPHRARDANEWHCRFVDIDAQAGEIFRKWPR